MLFTVYETTNIINGKTYIGSHRTPEPDDSYLGSGKYLKQAIDKYGREAFRKKVLFIFDNVDEMNRMERSLVTEDYVRSSRTYNSSIGGSGGGNVHLEQRTERYDEIINKISVSNTGKVRTDAMKEHQRRLKLGVPNPKTAAKLSRTWTVTYPDGREEEIVNMKTFCDLNNLCRACMSKVAQGKRKQHNGFSCKKKD